MIITIDPGQGCEVHLAGTHDAVWVRHNGDHVEVREFVNSHDREGDGGLVYADKLHPLTSKCPRDSQALNTFEATLLMAKVGASVKWEGRKAIVEYGTNTFIETARADTPEAKADAFCAAMTVVGLFNGHRRHSSRG